MSAKTKGKEKEQKGKKYSTKDVYQEDYDRRDDGGTKKIGYLDTSKHDDVEFYSIKEKRNSLDIIPYIITTDNHPQGRAKGKVDYKLDIWVHRFIGEEESSVLCLRQTFNKPCPICEEIKRMISSQEYSYKDDEIKRLKAKHREIYNVIDLESDEKKIKLFDMNHFEFQKEIIEEAEAGGDGEFITFAEIDDGMTIQFRGTEREGKDFKNSYKPKSFKFVERDESYDDDIVEEAYSLDALLIIPTYDEVKEMLFGKEEEDDDSDSKTKKSTKSKVEHDEEEDEKPVKRKSKQEKEEDEDDDEEEDEDEDEDSTKDKKKSDKSDKKNKKGKCPAGGEFGTDCDNLPECKKCKEWDDCCDAQGG